MNPATSYYPVGDLRVSDADRDRALGELTEAFQAGRITADEFDQRSGQALSARTGNELTLLLADLPHERARAEAAQRPARCQLVPRIVAGASAASAISLAAAAVTNALSHPAAAPAPGNRKLAEEVLGHLGLKATIPPLRPLPPAGFDWVGTITPAAIALLLVVVVIVALRVARRRPQGQRG